MRLRSAAPCVVIAAALLVAGVDYSAPGARLDPDPHNLDLLASAQPTTDRPAVSDAAFDDVMRHHDGRVDRGSVEHVVRKRPAARSILTFRDEVDAAHLQKPTLVRLDRSVEDHIELDLRRVREELQGRAFYGMK